MTRFRSGSGVSSFAPTPPLWRLGHNTAPSAKARLTPFRLVNREVAEHGCFVCGAVVLVLARLQLDRHRPPLEANGREVFGEAMWPVQREAVDGRVVMDYEGVASRGQRLDAVAALGKGDFERSVNPRRADQIRARRRTEASGSHYERGNECSRKGCNKRVTTIHCAPSLRERLAPSHTGARLLRFAGPMRTTGRAAGAREGGRAEDRRREAQYAVSGCQ